MSPLDATTRRRLRREVARARPAGVGLRSAIGEQELRALRRARRFDHPRGAPPEPLPEELEPPEDDAPPSEVLHWIEIVMVDEEGQPRPRERYELKLPDGSVRRGRLDTEGRARFERLTEGGASEVTFPDLDEEAWVRR